MGKKKKGRKMPLWRKIARAGVSLLGKGTGAGVALSPIIEEGQAHLVRGDVSSFLRFTQARYTGDGLKNLPLAVDTYGRLVAGLVIMFVTSKIAKRI